ncbi:hypothetical protein QAD02_013278 [Eretmocerus hayati]|uniref:Uncharacterized protein n=1 Tax=Eretmocerus hayati TaxID=131215 RepID=A0ACC2P351_9HYME|nr:hypothetical protein QAD02_013278 [Eretmocerus hayati]
MPLKMHVFVLQVLFLTLRDVLSFSQSTVDHSVFDLDPTILEKNIAAIFNKVAHSSATTKRSVPAYEAQISQSYSHTTTEATVFTFLTTPRIHHMVMPQTTNPPMYPEMPSYAPPARALFTPPLPPEYANPFADKPTLRGTNIEMHQNMRRPGPPPNFTPVQERIPIKPPDFVEETSKELNHAARRDNTHDSYGENSTESAKKENISNNLSEFVPSLHLNSISRILSGSNGRKQDIPEILLKPIPTKLPHHMIPKLTNSGPVTSQLTTRLPYRIQTSTTTPAVELKVNDSFTASETNEDLDKSRNEEKSSKIRQSDFAFDEQLSKSEPQPTLRHPGPSIPNRNFHDVSFLSTPWKVALSLQVYSTATVFTLTALFSVYKIVRFDDSNNFVTQSYFLTIHLSLTIVCTLRCFYLFYDAYNLGHSLPESVSKIFVFLPSSLLSVSFATLIMFMSRSSSVPSLFQNKYLSPVTLIAMFIIHIVLCISLYLSNFLLEYKVELKIFSLIYQSTHIIVCVSLGLCYMYVYRVIRSQLHATRTKSVNSHVPIDITLTTTNAAINTTLVTALLFIIMAFVQLYGIFEVREYPQPYPWLWWSWQLAVRVVELSMCCLIAWVTSLSRYSFREKQSQQHIVHSGFALFPCTNSISTENVDDSLYPAICGTNQAIQNYTIRTGKQVYDDNFPLNALPDQFHPSNTFDRRTSRNINSFNDFSHERRDTIGHIKSDVQQQMPPCNRSNESSLQRHIHENIGSSDSSMLVDEDGFVRFRNLGQIDNDPLSPQHLTCSNIGIRNFSVDGDLIVGDTPGPTLSMEPNHQSSMPRLHLSLHRKQCQIYNNT